MSTRMSLEMFNEIQDRLRTGAGKAQVSGTGQCTEKTVRGKYGNKKIQIDGHTFDSKLEAKRYQQLKWLERAGEIAELRLQVHFVLAPAVHLAGRRKMSPPLRYVADFVYVQAGKRVVEDTKGHITEGYRIKRHLMATVHGISIVEIGRGRG